jgi:adenine-specific DNA-methyltransferase
MTRSQKLELTWVGKDDRPRLEPRILIEDPALSYHATARVSPNDCFDNLLIQGDNLLALKALEQEYAGKVKCVFIDPPYNTGSAFEHYDDGVEHSLWLSLMRDRLEILRTLLSDDGSIWITIDDNEAHYLNYRTTITWQRKYSVSNNFKGIATICDFVLVYSKSSVFQNNLLPRSAESTARYQNPDNDERGPWKAVDYWNQATPEQRPNLTYEIVNPNTGAVVRNTKKAWKYTKEVHERHAEEKRIWWGKDGKSTVPALKLFLSEVRDGMTPHNWWPHEEVGHTDEAKKEMIGLFGPRNVFDTPKPERLMHRILSIATNPGDLVLDSFLGSGTAAAVAHKMGRSWIGIELGDHAITHCVPRMRKVIDGADPGGVTEQANWRGGGGFRFLHLAPSLLEKDHWGNWVVSREYNAAMLAEAVCKLEGFRCEPNPQAFWQQGKSTEQDFLYVTTQTLDARQLEWLSESVGPERSLLVLCRAWLGSAEAWPNLTLKKIPNAVLGRCEFGRDDYSLRIAALPSPPDSTPSDTDCDDKPSADGTSRTPGRRGKRAASRSAAKPDTQTDLLTGGES